MAAQTFSNAGWVSEPIYLPPPEDDFGDTYAPPLQELFVSA